ncbi:increased DNA methylation 1-like [Vicia villosa]|uniref:increased DNA methylation 1-like n=1 Tax=Vicia villosa TaxID=3911 RepID=UPI00273BCFF8|nr:increased DNA methylation 1-like [Vicia villosa]
MEKDDTMIAAAPIRFYGKDIAEMPFFATDEAFRGKGFCRLFIGLIEQFLLNLKVKQWIISSTRESLEMWKEKFNFDAIIDRGLKRKVASCNMLVLPQVIRLHKKIYDVQDLNMAQIPEE